jgi:hypothetical protein
VSPGRPPPVDGSPTSTWTYAAYLLGLGQAAQARPYLQAVAATDLERVSDPSLLLRDLAEACLFAGDAPCAAQAASQAKNALARKPMTAQFRADDQLIFQRTLDAISAAATDDRGSLEQICQDEQPAPAADACYLLGWLDEQHGDLTSAQSAYRAYLRLSPQWSFLRQGAEMRRHAADALR